MKKKMKLVTNVDMERLSSIHSDGRLAPKFDELLATVEIIKSEEAPPDLVTMNSIVRGIVKSNGSSHTISDDVRTMTLVYPQDADINGGRISILSPLGMELLGTRVGDIVDWRGHDGSVRKMKLDELLYQPEANGDWVL